MWIDKQGRVHHRSPAAAAAARESASIVVRHGRRALEFGFYPDTVSARAVLQAVEIIRDSRPGTHITLAPLGDGRQKRAFNDQPAAITMMMGFFAEARSSRNPRFLYERLPADRIAQDAGFGAIDEAWRTQPGRADQRLMEAVRASSSGRYLEVDPQDGATRLILRAVGAGYSLYGNGWKSGAVGERFEDMPDSDYARAAADAYREVFRTGQPVFEDVTALVHMMRTGPLLLTYRRVILPIGSGARPLRLLGATLDQRVRRLAFGTNAESGDVLQ